MIGCQRFKLFWLNSRFRLFRTSLFHFFGWNSFSQVCQLGALNVRVFRNWGSPSIPRRLYTGPDSELLLQLFNSFDLSKYFLRTSSPAWCLVTLNQVFLTAFDSTFVIVLFIRLKSKLRCDFVTWIPLSHGTSAWPKYTGCADAQCVVIDRFRSFYGAFLRCKLLLRVSKFVNVWVHRHITTFQHFSNVFVDVALVCHMLIEPVTKSLVVSRRVESIFCLKTFIYLNRRSVCVIKRMQQTMAIRCFCSRI